ncbi:hypothetical protein BLNAU_13398 [Blattamonas nauphoetae]|uniref:Uncharacterized protein n=1 Tax=Blattamonas nauphoetae TaxID=2049346 RepID=A0ABQ9XJK1_9EUKA|nr:hypothetical protein BLNAU_13398 [Blattamonas nauphoetae]
MRRTRLSTAWSIRNTQNDHPLRDRRDQKQASARERDQRVEKIGIDEEKRRFHFKFIRFDLCVTCSVQKRAVGRHTSHERQSRRQIVPLVVLSITRSSLPSQHADGVDGAKFELK